MIELEAPPTPPAVGTGPSAVATVRAGGHATVGGRRLRDAAVWVGLAGAAQLLSSWHLGWVALVVAVLLAGRATPSRRADALDRLVPVAWWLVAGLMLLGWAGPFLPWLGEPWAAVAVVALWTLPWRERRVGPGVRPAHAWAAARAWAAGVLPAAVFAVPYLTRGFADRLSLLGYGWDNAYHVLMVQGILKAHGYPVLDPSAVDSVPVSLLSYPQGPHQVWAILLRCAGIDGSRPELVVDGYIGLAIASYGLLGLSLVWAYRRLWPAALGWVSDLVGLAVVAAGLVLAPLPMLWRSGFFNYAIALGACAMALGLVVRPARAVTTRDLVLASGLVVVAATSYPLIAPVPAVAWLLVARRVVAVPPRRAAWSRLLVIAVLTLLACFPPAVPYLVNPVIGGDLVLFGGGLAQVPFWLAGLLLAASAAVLVVRVRRGRSGWALATVWATPWLLVALLAAWSLREQGFISYYPDKVLLAALVVSLPIAAAGGASVARSARTLPRQHAWTRLAATAVVGCLVVAGCIAAVPALPRDPAGRLVTWPGPDLLVEMWPAGSAYFSQGDRIVTGANSPEGWGGAVPVAADWLRPPVAQLGVSWTLEQRWMWVLSPTNTIAAQWLARTLERSPSLPVIATSVAQWARTNPGTGAVLIVGDDGTRKALEAALDDVPGQRPPGIRVVELAMPMPLVLGISSAPGGDDLPTLLRR